MTASTLTRALLPFLFALAITTPAAADEIRDRLSKQLSTGYPDYTIDSVCSGHLMNDVEVQYAVAATKKKSGGGAYFVIDDKGAPHRLGEFKGAPALRCLNIEEARAKDKELRQGSNGGRRLFIHGLLYVVCGQTDPANIACWQTTPRGTENAGNFPPPMPK